MIKTLLLYDGKMSSAERIADRLGCLIGSARVDEIEEAPEDLSPYDGVCFVFNFYGAVTAGKTQFFLSRLSAALEGKRVVMVGIGFSDLGYTKYVADAERNSGVSGISGIFIGSENEAIRAGYEIGRILHEPQHEMEEHHLTEEIESFIAAKQVLALAVSGQGYIDCSCQNYFYMNRVFYVVTEGGSPYRGILENGNVAAVIRDADSERVLHVSGKAVPVPVGSDEYYEVLAERGYTARELDEMAVNVLLLKIMPLHYKYRNSAFAAQGYDEEQLLDTEFRRRNREAGAAFASAEAARLARKSGADKAENFEEVRDTAEADAPEEAEESTDREETAVSGTAEGAWYAADADETAEGDDSGERGEGVYDIEEEPDGEGVNNIEEEPDGEGVYDIEEEPGDEGVYDIEEEPDGEDVYDIEEEPDGEGVYDIEEEPDDEGVYDIEEEPDGEGVYDIEEEPDDEGVSDTEEEPDGDEEVSEGWADDDEDEDDEDEDDYYEFREFLRSPRIDTEHLPRIDMSVIEKGNTGRIIVPEQEPEMSESRKAALRFDPAALFSENDGTTDAEELLPEAEEKERGEKPHGFRRNSSEGRDREESYDVEAMDGDSSDDYDGTEPDEEEGVSVPEFVTERAERRSARRKPRRPGLFGRIGRGIAGLLKIEDDDDEDA